MENIEVTADDLILKSPKIFFEEFPESSGTAIEVDDVKEIMIIFAKHHCEKIIREIHKKLILIENMRGPTIFNYPDIYDKDMDYYIDEESVLKSLKFLENIK